MLLGNVAGKKGTPGHASARWVRVIFVYDGVVYKHIELRDDIGMKYMEEEL
jgi:hypothetical protein